MRGEGREKGSGMGKFELKNGARLAAAAGLGLTLALGAAPVVALAAETSANVEEVAQADTETVDVVEVSDASGLKDALSTSGTYKLTGDITLTEPLSIATGVDVVLDLNGKTVDGTSISASSYIVSVEGALTVRDSSVQVEAPALNDIGVIEYQSGYMKAKNTVVRVCNGGAFTLEDGTLESTNSNPAVVNCVGNTDAATWDTVSTPSRVNINGGVVKGYQFGVTVFGKGASLYVGGGIISAAGVCVSGNGTVGTTENDGGTFIHIDGGMLFANDPNAPDDMKGCIYHPQSGTVEISGGRLLAEGGIGVIMRAGSLSVTGGSIESTGTVSGEFADASTNVSCAGIYLDYAANYPGATVATNTFSMTGGSVSSDDSVAPLVKTVATNSEIETNEAVTGGSFSGKLDGGKLPEGFVPEGYQMTEGQDGSWAPVVTDPVASINGTSYPSLVAAASAAQSGDTILLLQDTESGRVNLPAGTTLDLNEKTLTFSDHTFSSKIGLFVDSGAVTVRNGTIVDGRSRQVEDDAENATYGWNAIVVNGVGSVLSTEKLTVIGYAPKNVADYNYLVRAQNGGDLELGEGTVLKDDMQGLSYETETYGVVGVAISGMSDSGEVEPEDVAKLTVDGVDINVSGFAISGNGAAHGTEIAVNSGSVVSRESQGIYHPQAGSLTVNGGTIQGLTGIELRAGSLIVKDGATIKGGTGEFDYEPNGSGTTTSNAAVVVAQHTTKLPIDIDIQGGTFTATEAFAQANPQKNDQDSTNKISIDISGGSFEGGLYSENFAEKDGNGFVSGGTFSENPIGFVTDNSAVKINGDGTFTALERGNLPAGTYDVPDGDELTADDFQPGLSITTDGDGNVVATRPYVPPVSTGDAVKVEQSEGGKVSVSPSRADEGDEVTVTVIPEDGQELRGLTVTDEDGNAVEVRAGEKDGEFVFTMPDGDVTVSAEFGCDGGVSCPTHGFADVDQSQWYHDAVDWAVTNGVLNGYGDGGELMGPLATITRAEMAQVLWNRAGRPAAEADLSGFADVDASGWYADAVAWCLSEGIFRGYGDTFGTERAISREEVATVLWRLSGSPEPSTGLSSFSDAESVSEYATGALSWAVESGVVTGKDDGTKLDPQGVCTRAEAAAMLMRMSE